MKNEEQNIENKQGNGVLPCVSGCLLPSKSEIDKIIIVEYINRYGTNYDDNSLESAREGALIMVNWLLNNR
jgi:hypothetical protein